MSDKLTLNVRQVDDLVSRCISDLEPLSAREAVRKYPLLAMVVATAVPDIKEDQLARIISIAANRGLIDAAQKCQSCAGETGELNLCRSCYDSILGHKFSQYA
jgi:hypothetical protein